MKNEQARAFYGPKHVFAASEAEAIDVLLISDKLFRANTVAERKKVNNKCIFCQIISRIFFKHVFVKYVDLVDKVRESGGDVKIFSRY